MFFKRNQVEGAILRTLGVKDDGRGRDVKLKIKRLLVTDRRLGRARADRGYAFYTQKPKGSGVEVMFSGYEAFAIMAALIVLEYGIPQAKVVSILQDVRSDLEVAHRETLRKDRKELFDPQGVQAMARRAMIPVDNTAPVFLAFVKLDARRGRVHAFISVCRGLHALSSFFNEHSVPGSGATRFEFVRLICDLATNLSQTSPISRGRSTV
jgi:hypothetical protein